MQKIITIAAIGAVLSWHPAAAKAAEKTEAPVQYTSLAPRSGWQLDYSPESCNLMRTFGAGEETVMLKMEWADPKSVSFGLEVTGNYRLIPKAGAKLSYRFLPDGRETTWDHFFYGTGLIDGQPATTIVLGTSDFNGPPHKIVNEGIKKNKSGKRRRKSNDSAQAPMDTSTPAPMDLENAKTGVRVQALAIALAGQGAYRLELGSMEKPMRAVRQCLDDLLGGWGLDPAVMANLRSRPEPLGNPGQWFTPDDYPRSAWINGRSTIIQFRLMIDADGKVSGCKVTNLNHNPEFADTTCKLLSKRAKFSPAIDANGNSVPSFYISYVHWST